VAYSTLRVLECSRCCERYDADRTQGLCRCGAPLLARYDVEEAARSFSRERIAGRQATLWRYHELLPVRDPRHVVCLGEGMTPLLHLPRLGAATGSTGSW